MCALASTNPPLLPDQHTRTAASVVLEKAFERHHAAGKYADTPVGTFVVRGENIVLIAELVSVNPAPPQCSGRALAALRGSLSGAYVVPMRASPSGPIVLRPYCAGRGQGKGAPGAGEGEHGRGPARRGGGGGLTGCESQCCPLNVALLLPPDPCAAVGEGGCLNACLLLHRHSCSRRTAPLACTHEPRASTRRAHTPKRSQEQGVARRRRRAGVPTANRVATEAALSAESVR